MTRKLNDWSLVQAFYDLGHTFQECKERFGFSAQSWYKAVKRGSIALRGDDSDRLKKRGPGNPQYDWAAVQEHYDAGHSYRECRAMFGFSAGS